MKRATQSDLLLIVVVRIAASRRALLFTATTGLAIILVTHASQRNAVLDFYFVDSLRIADPWMYSLNAICSVIDCAQANSVTKVWRCHGIFSVTDASLADAAFNSDRARFLT